MQEHPLKTLERLDPKLLKLVEEARQLAFSDGALPRKFKLLIAMALLAASGGESGVKSLAQVALQAGATKEEITEVLRVTQYTSGVGSVFTAAMGLNELF